MRSLTAPWLRVTGDEADRAATAASACGPTGWLMLRSCAVKLSISRSAVCTSWLMSCKGTHDSQVRCVQVSQDAKSSVLRDVKQTLSWWMQDRPVVASPQQSKMAGRADCPGVEL